MLKLLSTKNQLNCKTLVKSILLVYLKRTKTNVCILIF